MAADSCVGEGRPQFDRAALLSRQGLVTGSKSGFHIVLFVRLRRRSFIAARVVPYLQRQRLLVVLTIDISSDGGGRIVSKATVPRSTRG